MTTRTLIKSVCLAAALAMAVSGCGRKGALERPGVSAAPVDDAAETQAPAIKERPFILDGLLD